MTLKPTLVSRMLVRAVVAVLAFALIAPPPRATAATGILYVPATGHYMRGVFRDFWDKNGGLANFGYPLTEEYIDPLTGRVFQYYERARFERASPEAGVVELGLLGREFLGARVFAPVDPIETTSQRRYFPETGQIVQYGFKTIWETRGGLPIFGLPLSSEVQEVAGDGTIRTVQYFERARFEFWPELPDGQRVVISDLGRELVPPELTAPLAPDSPPPGPIQLDPPPLGRPLVPASESASVTPQISVRGQRFTFTAEGFQPGEKVGVWINVPDGTVKTLNFQVEANAEGAIASDQLAYQSDAEAPLGIWSFVAQGITSEHTAVGYFRILESPFALLPEVEPGPSIPPNVNARVQPTEGPPGTIFFFDAGGFFANEPVKIEIFNPQEQPIAGNLNVVADARGRISDAGVYYLTLPDAPGGVYSFVATGERSQVVARAYFTVR